MLTKHRYDRNVLNSNKWKDSTSRIASQTTMSGVDYDIVSNSTNASNRYRGRHNSTSIFSKRLCNRVKSIAEYSDFQRNTHVRPNHDHAEAL